MASRELEGPLLGIKTFKCKPGNWLSRGLGDTSRVLTLSMLGSPPYWPNPSNIDTTSHQYLKTGEVALGDPDASFDVVYLKDVLEHYGRQERLLLIGEAARVTKNGGRVVALSRCCDDAEEAYNLAKKHGIDTTQFLASRLGNRDIAMLKPTNAAFFQDLTVVVSRQILVKTMNSLGLQDATLEHMWGITGRFPIRRFHVGLCWLIARGK